MDDAYICETKEFWSSFGVIDVWWSGVSKLTYNTALGTAVERSAFSKLNGASEEIFCLKASRRQQPWVIYSRRQQKLDQSGPGGARCTNWTWLIKKLPSALVGHACSVFSAVAAKGRQHECCVEGLATLMMGGEEENMAVREASRQLTRVCCCDECLQQCWYNTSTTPRIADLTLNWPHDGTTSKAENC